MKKRPVLIKLLAVSILAVPIVCFTILSQLDKNFYHVLSPLLKIEFILLNVTSIVSAIGVWRTRPWGFRLFITYVGIIVATDLVDFITNPHGRNLWHYLDIGFAVAGIAVIFRKRNRDVFYNEAIRWWERATRIRVNLDGTVKSENGILQANFINMSQSGCLTTLQNTLPSGNIVKVEFEIKGQKFMIPARVVRLNPKPQGLAFEFLHKGLFDRIRLGLILRSNKEVLSKAVA